MASALALARAPRWPPALSPPTDTSQSRPPRCACRPPRVATPLPLHQAARILPAAPCPQRRRQVSCSAGQSERAGIEAAAGGSTRLVPGGHPVPAPPAGGGDDDVAAAIRGGRIRRSEALRLVDEALAGGQERRALGLIAALQESQAPLRGFGRAAQVPQRQYSLEDLRLHKIDAARLLSPEDATLGGVRRAVQVALAAAGVASWQLLHLSQAQLLAAVVAVLFVATVDQIVNGGGGEALIIDTLGHALSPKYRERVALHEAGHFLVSYLLGVLPRAYTLSSLDALRRYGALNVQAGTQFVDVEFQQEVKEGKVSSKMLDCFSCVALAGVASETLVFERAEGGLADVQQLDAMFSGLGFTQKKADSQVRWAVLNTTTLLRRHAALHSRLAAAMAAGRSVGECILLIEDGLAEAEEI